MSPKEKKKASQSRARYVTANLRAVQAVRAKKLDRIMQASFANPTLLDEEVELQLEIEPKQPQPAERP